MKLYNWNLLFAALNAAILETPHGHWWNAFAAVYCLGLAIFGAVERLGKQ
jgi:hypothetical protein